jgi:hypothetical protein
VDEVTTFIARQNDAINNIIKHKNMPDISQAVGVRFIDQRLNQLVHIPFTHVQLVQVTNALCSMQPQSARVDKLTVMTDCGRTVACGLIGFQFAYLPLETWLSSRKLPSLHHRMIVLELLVGTKLSISNLSQEWEAAWKYGGLSLWNQLKGSDLTAHSLHLTAAGARTAAAELTTACAPTSASATVVYTSSSLY